MKLLKNFLINLLINIKVDWIDFSMKDSGFIFDCVHLLYYKCHKMNPNRGEIYNFPDSIKSKKATTNPINKDTQMLEFNQY